MYCSSSYFSLTKYHWNLIIITLTLVDPHLKILMYFFLQNFSFLEVSNTTTCIPKLLATMGTGGKTISYNGCAAQVFFAFLLEAAEFYLLATMSYDRYVAICKPLHYTTIVNNKICIQFVFCSWLARFFVIFPPLLLGLNLGFWASNTVGHFYCDTTPLLQIFCSDTEIFEMMGYISALLTLVVTLILSYTYITKTILKILSTNQRKEAFSACYSYMVVITLYHDSCIFMYAKSSIKQRIFFSKGIAVLNSSVAPLLNPFIYTLQN